MTSAGQPRPTVVSKVIVAVLWSKVILVKVCPPNDVSSHCCGKNATDGHGRAHKAFLFRVEHEGHLKSNKNSSN